MRCQTCGHKSENEDEFEVHETQLELWLTFCKPCVKVLGLNEGK